MSHNQTLLPRPPFLLKPTKVGNKEGKSTELWMTRYFLEKDLSLAFIPHLRDMLACDDFTMCATSILWRSRRLTMEPVIDIASITDPLDSSHEVEAVISELVAA
jgi:hypothetical protein